MPPWWSAQPLLAALIVIGSALSMEIVASLVHRHWMHGRGWGWHRSHHEGSHHDRSKRLRFEPNDRFGLIFAAIAIGLMLVGEGAWWPLYWVGIGMTLYGVLYALLHDGLVHRRWPVPWAPRRGYLRRLVQAHRLHHAVTSRRGAVSFGFLYAPPAALLVAELRAGRFGSGPAPPGWNRSTQGTTGLLLALMLVVAWALLQFYGLFVHRWTVEGLWLVPFVVALICWLDVGLFIVAHDAMHGSLVPTNRRLNDAVGRLCLMLYAGFALGRFTPNHMGHHRSPGSADDPDFHGASARFWPWYASFMRRYFGWREAAGLALAFVLLVVVFRAPVVNVLVFWALPAALSSVQLFAFGTWLTHRPSARGFDDHHRARSNAYGWWASLITCFHFGYHHEHHLRPDAPWWRLPSVRASTDPPSTSRAPRQDEGRPCPPPR